MQTSTIARILDAAIALTVLASVALTVAPASATAQPASPLQAGKAREYRMIDSDSGEVLWRSKSWKGADPAHPERWTQIVYANGDRQLAQCVMANGIDRPATSRAAVMFNAAGLVDTTEFDTFDPSYYPFLHRPLPAQRMEPASCFSPRAVDLGALQRGEETSLYMWLNDSINFRLTFKLEGKESVTVPAGTFEAWKVRARVDMTTFFPNLPAWAANTLGIFSPDVYVWAIVSDDGDVEVVRQTGLPIGKHKHAVQELTATSDPPALASTDLDSLRNARLAGDSGKIALDNSGTFQMADLRGRVVMGSANDPAGELKVVRTRFTDGLVMEARSIVNESASPKTSSMEQRSYAPDGRLVQKEHLAFRADSFPLEPDLELPEDLYAGSFTLAEVIPRFRPQADADASFHALGFDGGVSEIRMWPAGTAAAPVDGDDALHVKLKPVVDLPFFLKPLSYFLVPTFDVYLQNAAPYRMLEFTGPFGPPGSPPAHFIADAHIQSPEWPSYESVAPALRKSPP